MTTTVPLPGTFISQLPAATSLTGTELVPVVQAGTTKTTTVSAMSQAVGAQTPWLSNINGSNFTLTNAKILATGSTTARTLDVRFSDIVNVKDYGAVGDNSTDDTSALQAAINAAWAQTLASHGAVSNKILFFPPGNYKITSALQIKGAFGVSMIGSGNQSTVINQVTTGATAISIKGCAYSSFRDFAVNSTGSGGIGIDLDGGGGTYIGTQFVTFSQVSFGTPGGFTNCDYGFRHMQTDGNNGNNISFLNCTWGGCNVAAFKANSFNALNIEFYNGDIQGCSNYGIWIQAGSATNISGISFENGSSNVYDIFLVNSGGVDGTVISGCRTESANFVNNSFHNMTMIGCSQPVTSDGYFYNGANNVQVSIINCYSQAGRLFSTQPAFISGSRFDRSNFYQQKPGDGGAIANTPYFYHNLTVNGTLYNDGYVYGGTISRRVINSATDFTYTDNFAGDLEATFLHGGNFGWDAYCSQNDKNGYFGGGNNYGFAYAGEVLCQFYGYGNSSAGIGGFFNYCQLDAAIDSPTPGSETGKWVFVTRQSGVDNTQNMQVGKGLAVGSSTVALPGQGNIAAGGTVLTGTSSVGGLPAAGTVGRRYFVTDASTNTFATVVASGGSNKVPVWDDGTNWRIG